MNNKSIDTLVKKIMDGKWFDWESAAQVLSFVVKLYQLHTVVHCDTSEGKDAVKKIARELGKLVDDPQFLRREEKEEKNNLLRRHLRDLGKPRRIVGLPQYPEWNNDEVMRSAEGAFADASLTNELLREFLVEFDLLEQVKNVLPDMHTSWDMDVASPLFSKDSWLRWWHWAKYYFFVVLDDFAAY